MKKNLLSFFMLVVCLGILSTKSIAQEAPGTYGEELGIDGTVAFSSETTPPPNVKNVKRNNGNGTTATGFAEARLEIVGNYAGNIYLVGITYLDNLTSVLKNAVQYNAGIQDKGFISYPLSNNINPAKKLMFHFKCENGSSFCIPEN